MPQKLGRLGRVMLQMLRRVISYVNKKKHMNNRSQRVSLCSWLILAFTTPAGVLFSQTNLSDIHLVAQQVNHVASRLSAFERTKSLDELEEAMNTMERISPFGTSNDVISAQTRQQKAEMWLKLLAATEQNLDPNYDKNVAIQLNLAPPPDGGVEWPSGVDPKVIKDPKARSEYEDALKTNREKAERYGFQLRLHRIAARVTMDVERFLKSSYTSSQSDKKEIDEVLKRSALSPTGRQKLKSILADGAIGGSEH